jgi:hypothetical protein
VRAVDAYRFGPLRWIDDADAVTLSSQSISLPKSWYHAESW